MRLILLLIVKPLGIACWVVGISLAAPFVVAGGWLESKADDLEAGWRRGSKQNWLWRWARSQKK